MTVLALLTDAHGANGGIAKVNRDLLAALCAAPQVKTVTALPRIQPPFEGALPEKLDLRDDAAGGLGAFVRTLTQTVSRDRSYGLVVCGHLHLLPFAYLAARACRARLVLVVHGIEAWEPSPHPLANRLARYVDQAVAVSDYSRRRFCAWSALPVDRVTVIPNAVDLDVFTPGPRSDELAGRYGLRGRRVVMTLGRLAGEARAKGFDRVLEALPAVAEQVPEVTYLVAGDGPDRPRLEAKARTLGVADRVVFAGFVDEAEKTDHYRLADCFAMPSRGEGFGIALIEAMACGIPAIASSADGSREAVRGGLLGTVVDPDDSRAVAAAISAALRSGPSVPRGLAHFSRARFAERWLNVVTAPTAPRPVLPIAYSG